MGTTPDGALIRDLNDTGTSAAFALTPTEEHVVTSAIIRAADSG